MKARQGAFAMSYLFQDISEVEDFLHSFALATPADRSRFGSLTVAFDAAVNEKGDHFPAQVLTVWYRTDLSMSLAGLRQKLTASLRGLGHPTDERIRDLLIAYFAVIKQIHNGTSIGVLNEILTQIVSADLRQYFALQLPGFEHYQFEVGPFKIGPLDAQQLNYWSKKAGSDYAVRQFDGLHGLPFAISRISKVKAMAWQRLMRTFEGGGYPAPIAQLLKKLATAYYQQLSSAYFQPFLDDLRLAQEIPQALGSGWLEVDELTRFIQARQISIYTGMEGQSTGWVNPVDLRGFLNLGGAHIGVPYVNRELKDRFGTADDGPIDALIKLYCSFLAVAARHEAANRIPDAFLHHVIALDLLLGERSGSTATVTKRAAILVFSALGRPHAAVLSDCDDIYDARSRYVHKGTKPTYEFIRRVEIITREIALCLFRLRQTEANKGPGFRDKWIRSIQILVSKADAEVQITDDELHHVGAAAAGDYNIQDLARGFRAPPTTD